MVKSFMLWVAATKSFLKYQGPEGGEGRGGRHGC